MRPSVVWLIGAPSPVGGTVVDGRRSARVNSTLPFVVTSRSVAETREAFPPESVLSISVTAMRVSGATPAPTEMCSRVEAVCS